MEVAALCPLTDIDRRVATLAYRAHLHIAVEHAPAFVAGYQEAPLTAGTMIPRSVAARKSIRLGRDGAYLLRVVRLPLGWFSTTQKGTMNAQASKVNSNAYAEPELARLTGLTA